MSSTQHVLSHAHHRLLLEEMMLLDEDSELTCTVSSDHYFLQQIPSKSLIQKCLEQAPIRPIFLDRKVIFPFNLTVVSNTSITDSAGRTHYMWIIVVI